MGSVWCSKILMNWHCGGKTELSRFIRNDVKYEIVGVAGDTLHRFLTMDFVADAELQRLVSNSTELLRTLAN